MAYTSHALPSLDSATDQVQRSNCKSAMAVVDLCLDTASVLSACSTDGYATVDVRHTART